MGRRAHSCNVVNTGNPLMKSPIDLLPGAARRFGHKVFSTILANRGIRLAPTLRSAEVQAALTLDPSQASRPPENPAIARLIASALARTDKPASRELFQLDGKPLPCWQPDDLEPGDDWLTAENYYPLYHALFRTLADGKATTRMLEIGVRTGYMAAAFAKAAPARCFYLGVDPNLYVGNGLALASATLRLLREHNSAFDFALMQGYSGEADMQDSIRHTAPFDIIHIDGDHTLNGKLIDLDLARRILASGGFVLVDDFDHVGIVSQAIERAFSLGWYREFAYAPTKRGLAILR